MGNTENIHITDDSFRELLGRYLNLSTLNNPKSEHLDQDTLSSFAEGNLSRRESRPVVSHLADCSFCRKITSELVRLDLAFERSTTTDAGAVAQSSPKVSEVLSGFLARIFGSGDSTVFAHQEPEKEEEEEEEDLNNDKEENK